MPIEPIMAFALLSAGLADPFADRAAVLDRAGFDESRWKAMEDGWARRFQEPGGAALADRFRALFVQAALDLAVAARRPAEQAGTPPASPRPLVPTLVSSAPPPRATHPLAATGNVDLGALRPAVPFGPPARVDPLGDTLESGARLPVPDLPFTKPPRTP